MKYVVYILKSLKDGNLYIGYTENLERRIKEHNSGKTKSLVNRRPLELIYNETYEDKYSAIKREKYFKTHKGWNELQHLMRR